MIISHIGGGIGNQLFMYAAGRRLAHKHNTELKLDLTFYQQYIGRPYALQLFNIRTKTASSEEIYRLKNFRHGREIENYKFMPEVLDYPDDVYLNGCWENERYFSDIADILRKEFTLKNPLSAAAQCWKEKILVAECSVSLHVRHGDFVYHPQNIGTDIFAILPPNYYHECINRLKREHKNLKLFVFSNDIQWCKKYLQPDVPTEYVVGGGCKMSKNFT